jgi:hypothetical protein
MVFRVPKAIDAFEKECQDGISLLPLLDTYTFRVLTTRPMCSVRKT